MLSQATLQGAEAVEAVLSATPDTPSPVIGIQENKITRNPLMEAVKQVRHLVARRSSLTIPDASRRRRDRQEGLCDGAQSA